MKISHHRGLARWRGIVLLAAAAAGLAGGGVAAQQQPSTPGAGLLHAFFGAPHAAAAAPASRSTASSNASTSGTLGEKAANASMMSAIERARQLGGAEGVAEAAGQGPSPQLLEDPSRIRELLGENPRWVWHIDPNQARADPMLIPWIAEKLLFDARDAEARSLEGVGKLADAVTVYEKLLASISDTAYRSQIEGRIAELRARIQKEEEEQKQKLAAGNTTQPTKPVVEPVLPPSIADGTRAIIYDPAHGSWVAIGDQILKPGDVVQDTQQGKVVVKSIEYQKVVFAVTNEFMTKDFEVEVKGDALP